MHLNVNLGAAHRYTVFLCGPEHIGGRDLHDRFVLADPVRIAAPGGLDCQPESWANTSTWSVLDEDDQQARLDDYDPQFEHFQAPGPARHLADGPRFVRRTC